MLAERNRFSRPLGMVRYGVAIVALVFAGMLVWALWAPLDKGVTVPGVVMVAENRKAVQPVSAGRIARLDVREGQYVLSGQTLVVLDNTSVLALRDNLLHQQSEARANLSRLLAERDNLSHVIFQDQPARVDMQQDPLFISNLRSAQQQLFHSRRVSRQQETTAMRSAINGMTAQIAGTQSMVQNYQSQLLLLNQQLLRLRPLAEQGYVAANRLSELERQYFQLSGTQQQERSNIIRLQQQRFELEQTLAQRDSDYQKEIHSQLIETQHTQQDLGQRLRAAEYELENTVITAPASGLVVGLALHTQGGVVGSGQILMEIVPDKQPLQIAAQLPVNLIDKVSPGAQVDLLFTAFNQSTTPRITGSITLVGADQLQNPATDQPYYALFIQVEGENNDFVETFNVRPGMPVEAFVRTGERSLFNYLFKPLSDRLKLALTEE